MLVLILVALDELQIILLFKDSRDVRVPEFNLISEFFALHKTPFSDY